MTEAVAPTQDRSAAVSLVEVGRTFDTRGATVTALEDFSLEIERGEFICIVGPSGCGKSTILRILGGLDHPSSGEVRIFSTGSDQPLTSIVFQEGSIFPWMTVRQNIEYGLKMRRVGHRARRDASDHYLAMTGLAKFCDAYPHQLSGGMRQRTSVARAFANDPQILLMDEPFGALDEQTRLVLQQELLRIWEATGKTVLFITHSLDEALLLSDRVVVMSGRPGRVKKVIEVPFARPRDLYQLKTQPEYGRLARELWDMLEVQTE